MTNTTLVYQLIACVLFFHIIWHFENKYDKYKCSNIFSLWGSILLSLFSIIYAYTGDNYYSSLTFAIFISYLSLETIYGTIYFRESMPLLTGYIHHTIYLFFILYLLYNYEFSSIAFLSLGFLEEIPTILLNIKRYYGIKSESFNLAYGILFLIFRVLYHIYLINKVYYIDNYAFSFGILGLIAHVKFLYDWYVKYNKKKLEK